MELPLTTTPPVGVYMSHGIKVATHAGPAGELSRILAAALDSLAATDPEEEEDAGIVGVTVSHAVDGGIATVIVMGTVVTLRDGRFISSLGDSPSLVRRD